MGSTVSAKNNQHAGADLLATLAAASDGKAQSRLKPTAAETKPSRQFDAFLSDERPSAAADAPMPSKSPKAAAKDVREDQKAQSQAPSKPVSSAPARDQVASEPRNTPKSERNDSRTNGSEQSVKERSPVATQSQAEGLSPQNEKNQQSAEPRVASQQRPTAVAAVKAALGQQTSDVQVSDEELQKLTTIFLRNGEPGGTAPVLALLSGNVELLEPAQIPDLVSSNPFISEAFSEPDTGKFIDQPRSLGELLSEIEPAQNVLEEIKRTGIDLSQLVTPRQFFDALGIDPNRVSIELSQLKTNVQMSNGLAPYMIRAAKVRGQSGVSGSGEVMPTEVRRQVSETPVVRAGDVKPTKQGFGSPQPSPVPVTGFAVASNTAVTNDQPAVRDHADSKPVVISAVPEMSAVGPGPESLAQVELAPTSVPKAESDSIEPKQAVISMKADDARLDEDWIPSVEEIPMERQPLVRSVAVDPFTSIGRGTDVKSINFAREVGADLPARSVEISREEELVAEDVDAEVSFEPISMMGEPASQPVEAAIKEPLRTEITQPIEPAAEPRVAPKAERIDAAGGQWSFERSAMPASSIGGALAQVHQSKVDVGQQNQPIDLGQLIERLSSAGFSAGRSSTRGGTDSDQSQPRDSKPQISTSVLSASKPEVASTFGLDEAVKTSAPEIPSDQLTRKVLEKAEMMLKDGGGSVKVEVETAEFGKVEVAIKVDGDKLDLKVLTPTENTRDLIHQGLGKLREQLADQNLQLNKADVGVSTNLSWNQGQSSSAQFEQNRENGRAPQAQSHQSKETAKVIPLMPRARYQANPHHVGQIQVAV